MKYQLFPSHAAAGKVETTRKQFFQTSRANKSELTKWFRLNAAKGRSTFLQVSVVNDGLSKAGSPAGAGRRSPWLPDMAKLSRNQDEWVSADGCYLLVRFLFLKRFEMQMRARKKSTTKHTQTTLRRLSSERPVLKRPSKHHHPQEKSLASTEYFEEPWLMDIHARGPTEAPHERQYVPFRAC